MESPKQSIKPPTAYLHCAAVRATAVVAIALSIALATQARAQVTRETPYMGWTTWSLQAHFGSSEATGDAFQNEVNVRANSDAMRSTGLQSHGFEYINIDGDWDYGLMCQCGDPTGWDPYGRPLGDPKRFPSGMGALAA